jgi:arylsulfatase A-like enzyme/Tfp pilus assembly protein PilF
LIARPAAAVLCAAALAAACAPDRPRDVVVVTLDTLRADRLGCYGNPAGLTPHLDALAEESTLFEHAVAPAPITLPSHASLFTGRYPTATGVRNNGTFVVPEHERTLAEILRDAGWSTAAVVAAYPLERRYGLAQGFDRYDDRLPSITAASPGVIPLFFSERKASSVTDRALAAWEAMAGPPRFLWVHYFDPHAPYEPPEPFASRFRDRPYDGEVAYLDAEVGRLLRGILDASPGVIVAVVSDHGEGLGDHGEQTHGVFLYDSTLRVPMILRAPGWFPAGRRVSTPVSLIDLLPTVLSLLGLPATEGLQGIDLLPLTDGAGEPQRSLYAESYLPLLEYRFSPLAAVRHGRLKYIAAPAPELFDLEEDPDETRNLHGAHPDEERLALELTALAARTTAGESNAAGIDERAAARLRSLGYVAGGSVNLDPGVSAGRDPKSMTAYIRRHDEALGRIADGRIESGLALLRELIGEAPENFVARFHLAGALLAVGRYGEAEAELLEVVGRDPGFYGAAVMLGEVQGRLGKIDEAVARYRRAASLVPGLAEPLYQLGLLYEEYGRFEDAGAAFLEALAREPTNAEIGRALVRLREGRGELERAAEDLHRIAQAHPTSGTIRRLIVESRLRLGQIDAAADALREAAALDIEASELALLEGEVLLLQGDPRGAERSFRSAVEASPTDRSARFGLARALLAQDRAREAEIELARVLQIDPAFAAAHTTRAAYLERRGDREAAAAAYLRALAIDPGDARAREGLARVTAP